MHLQMARIFGVSEEIIGLTIIAIGTSMPEMATSCVAAFRHQNGIALGNVVGSGHDQRTFFTYQLGQTGLPYPGCGRYFLEAASF